MIFFVGSGSALCMIEKIDIISVNNTLVVWLVMMGIRVKIAVRYAACALNYSVMARMSSIKRPFLESQNILLGFSMQFVNDILIVLSISQFDNGLIGYNTVVNVIGEVKIFFDMFHQFSIYCLLLRISIIFLGMCSLGFQNSVKSLQGISFAENHH